MVSFHRSRNTSSQESMKQFISKPNYPKEKLRKPVVCLEHHPKLNELWYLWLLKTVFSFSRIKQRKYEMDSFYMQRNYQEHEQLLSP